LEEGCVHSDELPAGVALRPQPVAVRQVAPGVLRVLEDRGFQLGVRRPLAELVLGHRDLLSLAKRRLPRGPTYRKRAPASAKVLDRSLPADYAPLDDGPPATRVHAWSA